MSTYNVDLESPETRMASGILSHSGLSVEGSDEPEVFGVTAAADSMGLGFTRFIYPHLSLLILINFGSKGRFETGFSSYPILSSSVLCHVASKRWANLARSLTREALSSTGAPMSHAAVWQVAGDLDAPTTFLLNLGMAKILICIAFYIRNLWL